MQEIFHGYVLLGFDREQLVSEVLDDEIDIRIPQAYTVVRLNVDLRCANFDDFQLLI